MNGPLRKYLVSPPSKYDELGIIHFYPQPTLIRMDKFAVLYR